MCVRDVTNSKNSSIDLDSTQRHTYVPQSSQDKHVTYLEYYPPVLIVSNCYQEEAPEPKKLRVTVLSNQANRSPLQAQKDRMRLNFLDVVCKEYLG